MMVSGAVVRNVENPPQGVRILTNPMHLSENSSNFSQSSSVFYDYNGHIYTKKEFAIEINASLTLLIGLIQIVLGFCRMGFVTLFFSDAVFNAFAAGCAVHVASAQIPYVLGFEVKQYYCPLKLFFVCYTSIV